MRYLVRWVGFTPDHDSWLPPRLLGMTRKQVDAWVKQTHRLDPLVLLPGPFVTPKGTEHSEVRVTAADRAAIAAARAAAATYT